MLHVFDLDGVLADFPLAFTRLANHHFDTAIQSAGQQRQWSFEDGGLLTVDQFNTLWDYVNHAPEWWEAVPDLTTAGDKAAMHELGEVLYMTARSGRHPGRQSERWLLAHGFPAGKVVVSHDKLASLRQLRVPLRIIEDRPTTIQKLQDAGVDVVTRDWPYNRHVEAKARVSSVSEFCGLDA